MLPDSIKFNIQSNLDDDIIGVSKVYGGDINQTAKIEFSSGHSLFVKWNTSAPKTMFEAEANGLELLGSASSGLEIPCVVLQHDNFLTLTWIDEAGGQPNSAYEFGIELARLHRKTASSYGLDHDNFIGRLPQSNNQHSNWPDFFALERIEPQIKMGVESGKLTRTILKDAEQFYRKLGSIFPTEKPALIHGDLWNGNYMFTQNGGTTIYDPAVYYSHREMELAMTRLFGGFSANFYEGYNDEFPLDEGFESRVNICNLYPILVHANLFGGSYCRQAENIIQRYA